MADFSHPENTAGNNASARFGGRWRLPKGKLFRGRHFPNFLFEVALNVAVQRRQTAGASGVLNTVHHFGGPIFLLDLLIDEPVHEHLRGIILCFQCGFENGVDALSIVVFLRLRLSRHFEQCFEILIGRGNPGYPRCLAAVREVFENALGVGALLAGLLDEVFAETLEISDIAPHRQRQIEMSRCQFLITLAVQFLNDLVVGFGF